MGDGGGQRHTRGSGGALDDCHGSSRTGGGVVDKVGRKHWVGGREWSTSAPGGERWGGVNAFGKNYTHILAHKHTLLPFSAEPITARPRHRRLRVSKCMPRLHCHPPLSHRLSTRSCCRCHCTPPHPSLPPRAALTASLLAYFWRLAAGGRRTLLPLALPRSLHGPLTTTRPAFLPHPPRYAARPSSAANPLVQHPTFVPAAPPLAVPIQRPHPHTSAHTADRPLPSLPAHGRRRPQSSLALCIFWALS